MGVALPLYNFESFNPQGCLVESLAEIGPVVLEKKIFKFHQCNYASSFIICPWNRPCSFIKRNLNPIHPRMLCAKFDWNWLSGSLEDAFLKFCQWIFTMSLSSPLGKMCDSSLEHIWFSFSQRVCLKLGHLFWKKKC